MDNCAGQASLLIVSDQSDRESASGRKQTSLR